MSNKVISLLSPGQQSSSDGCADEHPCFSASAQHQYARLHLPVAPKCNMQCNYCNRKFDCSNESRPGVVSCLLTPEQAIERVAVVAEKLDNLRVIGIAGPGDPLANPEHTFETVARLNKAFPQFVSCLSTNGLSLSRYANELIAHNVRHITVTMNAIDPLISKQIYQWMLFEGKRLKGEEAAECLLEQQTEGIRKLIAAGTRVKINSVMIPGVNDQHIHAVSQWVKALGVEIHNIMPLISRVEHNTHFSRIGQREPTYSELTELRDLCGMDMKMMRHCRQCRADAVGLLGEDHSGCLKKPSAVSDSAEKSDVKSSAELVLKVGPVEATPGKTDVVHPLAEGSLQVSPSFLSAVAPTRTRRILQAPAVARNKGLRVAVAADSRGLLSVHFGYARQFEIYRYKAGEFELEGIVRTDQYCLGECGDDKDVLMENAVKALSGCQVLLCARIGSYPRRMLEAAGIAVLLQYAMDSVPDALAGYAQQILSEQSGKVCEGPLCM